MKGPRDRCQTITGHKGSMKLSNSGDDDQEDHDQTNAVGDEARDAGPEKGILRRRSRLQRVEFSLFKHSLVFQGPFVFKFLLTDPSRENNIVEGKLVRPEMGVEEVNGEDESCRQKGLVGVKDDADVEDPAREEFGEKYREPECQAGEPDDPDPPEDSQVIELFPVCEPVELGTFTKSEEPHDVPRHILEILGPRHHGVWSDCPL